MADITEIKRALEVRCLEVVQYLLPRGVLVGREWCVGSTAGEPGHSLKVCVQGRNLGKWADFGATGESGDLIDLWQAVRRLSLVAALPDMRAWLGITAPKFEKAPKTYRRPAEPRGAPPRSAVLDYLIGERRLSAGAIAAYRVQEDARTVVLPSYLPDGELAFVKRLSIDRTPSGKKIISVEPGCEPVLFGWQAIDPEAREVTLTEGEIDAMASWDYGSPALSLPFGGGRGEKQAWIEAEYERMARFETIYLALDMDAEGDAAADEIASRLGRHRCRRVLLPRKDLNQCLQDGITADEIGQRVADARSLDPPELVRAGAFADDVVALFWPPDGREPGYRLPWQKMADRLRFRAGELTLCTGATDAGKSQLLSHVLVGLGEQGARICAASLEMAPKQFLRRAVRQAGNTHRPPEPFIREIVGWLDEWLWLFGVVGKTTVKRVLEVFEYARARYACDVFVIDSLMRLGVSPEDFEAQERAIFELVSWCVGKEVHLHLVAHARKQGAEWASAAGRALATRADSPIGQGAIITCPAPTLSALPKSCATKRKRTARYLPTARRWSGW